MMTLLALFVGICLITLIARHEEDDKLFWKLFVSFIGAYAAVAIAMNVMHSDKKQDKVVMVEKSPMQVAESVPLLSAVLADTSLTPALREKSPKPVGKELTFNRNNVILGEVHRNARGQPQWEMYFSDS